MTLAFHHSSNRSRKLARSRTLNRSRQQRRPAAKPVFARSLAAAALLVFISTAPLIAQSPTPAGQSPKPAGAAAQAAGDASRGKAVYARAGCANCHGAAGEGAGAIRLVPMSHQLAAFTTLVRQPASGVMPALTPAAASDADVAALYAYLRSLSPKTETAATAQLAGNVDNGKRLFAAAACYACHGYVGQGGSAGPRLGPPAVSFAVFERALRHPREEMPPYTVKSLSDQQVADIYSYVKTFPEPPDVNMIPLLKPPPDRKQ